MPVDLTPKALDALIERVARAWASIDGRADRFDACRTAPALDRTDGSYSGYLEDAKELLSQSGLADTIAALRAAPVAMRADPVAVARMFHEAYENLAPAHGYETRQDTRDFDPASANGKLMTAVCEAVMNALAIRALPLDAPAPVDPVAEAYREGWRFAYRQCEATGSVPNPDHPALRAASEKE